MKNMIISSLVLSSLTAFAGTTTLTVEGMHCTGCQKTIEKSVCGNEEIAKQVEKCEVKLTDEAKQTGQVVLTTKPETKVDVDVVAKQIKAAGDDYKVANVNIEEKVQKELAKGEKATAGGTTETTTTTTVTETHDHHGKVVKKETKKMKTVKKVMAKETKTTDTKTTPATTETEKKETK